MESIRIYRNVNASDKMFGLELADGAVLLLVFLGVFSVNREGLFSNALVLALAYTGLRALKRGKPQGYTLHLARFVLASRFKAAPRLEDHEQG